MIAIITNPRISNFDFTNQGNHVASYHEGARALGIQQIAAIFT